MTTRQRNQAGRTARAWTIALALSGVAMGALGATPPAAPDPAADTTIEVEHTRDGVVARKVVRGPVTPEQAAMRATIDREWRATVEGLLPLGGNLSNLLLDAQDPLQRQEFYRLVHSAMSQGYIGLLYANPDYPEFWPIWNQAFNTIDPNPDNVYYMAPIRDGGVYRISGNRGSVRIVSMVVGAGELLPYGRGTFGPTLAHYYLGKDVAVGKNGDFEFLLSAKRPAGYTGAWLPLPATATFINVRQTAYDWVHEVDARLAIDRIDIPSIQPRATAAQIDTNLKQIATWAENVTRISAGWYHGLLKEGLVNRMQYRELGNSGGVQGQRYIEGAFEIAADEALIIETEIPRECDYWAFQLTDDLFVSIDPVNRQTSLNGFVTGGLNGYSARLDKDGKFRAVVSASDPGVPNWLDSAGHGKGILYGRWLHCSSYPEPVVSKVKLADVRAHLPPGTPVVTPAERETALRLRRKGAQMRKRW